MHTLSFSLPPPFLLTLFILLYLPSMFFFITLTKTIPVKCYHTHTHTHTHPHPHILLFPIVSFCGCRCRHFIFYQAISVCLNKIIFYLYLPFYVSFFETSLLPPQPNSQSQLFKALEVTFNILIMVQPTSCVQ